jgi:hypothetical protein
VTCPWLERRIQTMENNHWLDHLRWLLLHDKGVALRADLEAASARYTTRVRELFEARQPGTFEIRYQDQVFGIGGTRDPLGIKCLHNHVGTRLAGEPTPLGELALTLIQLDLEPVGLGPLNCGGDCMARPRDFGLKPWEV